MRAIILAAGALPFLSLCVRGMLENGLGANPVEEVTHVTGEVALLLLLATLAVTPARRIFGLAELARHRRTLGLLAFGYACLHLLTYVVFDHFFSLESIAEDVAERRYITAGVAAFLLLVPLAITSTNVMMRRLGRRWLQLHRLVYVAATLAVVHFYWQAKADTAEPLFFACVLGGLLAYRAAVWARRRAR